MVRATDKTKFWNTYSHIYDGVRMSIPYDRLMTRFVHKMKLRDKLLILDLGCGTANLEQEIGKVSDSLSLEKMKVLGLDFSDGMLRKARKKCRKWSFMVFEKRDLSKGLFWLSDSSFDIIVGNNFLYAIDEKEKLIHDISKVLKPGGKLIINDPKPNTQTGEIIREHFSELKWKSLWRRLFGYIKEVISFIWAGLLPVLLTKLYIDPKMKKGEFRLVSKEEIYELFKDFSDIKISSAYGDQCWFIEVTKK